MRELLKEYYGLEIEYSRAYYDGMIFFINGDYYYLCKCYLSKEDVDKSYKLYLLLKNKGLILHDFIFNKDDELLSKDYVLLKLNYLIDNIDVNDLKRTNIVVDFEEKDDFYGIWTNKIDYYEENLFVEESNSLVVYSYDYFVGISESLLELYKNNKTQLGANYIVHRTFYSLSTIDYYNPLNIVVGDRLKDYSFLIRFNNDWNLLYELLENISYEEKVCLFVRLAFPFKYFYCINKLLFEEFDREEILVIVSEIDKYEDYLYKLEQITGIDIFYWIKKDN